MISLMISLRRTVLLRGYSGTIQLVPLAFVVLHELALAVQQSEVIRGHQSSSAHLHELA